MLTETYQFLVDSANGRHLKVYQSLGSVGKSIKGSASCYRADFSINIMLFNTNCAIHNDTYTSSINSSQAILYVTAS